MAIKERLLAAVTAIKNTDYLRVVTDDGASRKALVSDLAKQVVEGYAGSTLAGSAQSVKSAFDSLNGNRNIATALPTTAIVQTGTVNYDSDSNYFTAPVDGYIRVQLWGNADIGFRIAGISKANTPYTFAQAVYKAGTGTVMQPWFVKKGMKLYITDYTGGTNCNVGFFSLSSY